MKAHEHIKFNGVLLDSFLAQGCYRMRQDIFTTDLIWDNHNIYRVFWLRYPLDNFYFDSKAQKLLAATEGIFCEPASAISIAGLMKDLARSVIGEGSTIVCTLTGHGLKDPDTAIAQSTKPFLVDATRSAIEAVISDNMPK